MVSRGAHTPRATTLCSTASDLTLQFLHHRNSSALTAAFPSGVLVNMIISDVYLVYIIYVYIYVCMYILEEEYNLVSANPFCTVFFPRPVTGSLSASML